MQVKDKIVIVTGAGSGIGAATAKHFAKHKAKVVVSDIKEEKAQKIVDEINAAGGEAKVITANVSKFEEMEALIKKTVEGYLTSRAGAERSMLAVFLLCQNQLQVQTLLNLEFH